MIPPPMMMTKSTSGPSDQEWDESSVPVISERALARAHRTVRDFVRTYFPLHGVAPERVLDVWWLLVYVEGFVYQIDEENEAQVWSPPYDKTDDGDYYYYSTSGEHDGSGKSRRSP